jgi:hypothetical protein
MTAAADAMTVIEIRPHSWGWKVFEAPGVEPVFLEKRQAIDYAETRACFRKGEIRILVNRPGWVPNRRASRKGFVPTDLLPNRRKTLRSYNFAPEPTRGRSNPSD